MTLRFILAAYFLVFSLLALAESDSLNTTSDFMENIAPERSKKVLLIGIDGFQYEYLQKVATPQIDKFYILKAYTGGIDEQQTEQATSSGPAWATIMTGVWANKHEVTSNNSELASSDFPSLYRRINGHFSSAKLYGFATWEQTHTRYFKNDLALLQEESHGGHDLENLEKALFVLQEKPADFIFLHLDDVDHAGHAYCFGQEYEDAIEEADKRIGSLLNAVEARIRQTEFSNEDWLVLLVTDHGRDLQGCGHGSQTEQEKTVFIASNKAFHQTISNKVTNPNKGFNGIYNHIGQTAIAPTVLDYLGVNIRDEWLLEGGSLFEESALRGLVEGNSPYEFLWYVDREYVAKGILIEIWRNNILLAEVPYEVGQWLDLEPVERTNDYLFKMNGHIVAYRVEEFSILEKLSKFFDHVSAEFITLLEKIFSPFIRYFS